MTSQRESFKPYSSSLAPAAKNTNPVKLDEMDDKTLDNFIQHLFQRAVSIHKSTYAPPLFIPKDRNEKIKLVHDLRKMSYRIYGKDIKVKSTSEKPNIASISSPKVEQEVGKDASNEQDFKKVESIQPSIKPSNRTSIRSSIEDFENQDGDIFEWSEQTVEHSPSRFSQNFQTARHIAEMVSEKVTALKKSIPNQVTVDLSEQEFAQPDSVKVKFSQILQMARHGAEQFATKVAGRMKSNKMTIVLPTDDSDSETDNVTDLAAQSTQLPANTNSGIRQIVQLSKPGLLAKSSKKPELKKPSPTQLTVVRPIDEIEKEEEGNFFDLSAQIMAHPTTINNSFKQLLQLEVSVFSGGELKELHHVTPETPFKLQVGFFKKTVAKVSPTGDMLVRSPSKKIASVINQNSAKQALSSKSFVKVRQGQWVKIDNDDYDYLIRPALPVISPDYQEPVTNNRAIWKKFGIGSVVFHIFVLAASAAFDMLSTPELSKTAEPEFIQLDVSKLIEKPKPIVKPKLAAKPKPVAKPKAKSVTKPKPVAKAKPVKKAKPVIKPTVKKVTQSGLLAVLPSKKSASKSTSKTIALASNLDAVAGNANNSRVSVSGLTASVAGTKTSLSNGQLLNTKNGSSSLQGGGSAAALAGNGSSGENVRAAVTAGSYQQTIVSGGITRAQVKSVIDAHMNEITYCYETALAKNPNLGGKIVFEWKILSSGKVGKVGIDSSTVKSNSLHRCIKTQIKSWQFPQPQGSDVEVSYPFVFNMVGF